MTPARERNTLFLSPYTFLYLKQLSSNKKFLNKYGHAECTEGGTFIFAKKNASNISHCFVSTDHLQTQKVVSTDEDIF